MTGSELRSRFLEFFRSKGHAVVPSDSLVPLKDPSLLFTGAGMNQFKDCFLGVRKEMKRAASCQKCFRAGDVEKVGKTAGHLTFFEMLGNFSFGDYFKKEACLWAWEFMTRELRADPARLWVSVYEEDAEAASVWKDAVGVPAARIVRFGAKENFWPANAPTDGPNGPCGPCSEIHYDYGCCTLGKVCPDPAACQPGCPCGRFVEVWNLVFTQFDRQADGTLAPLPAKNIDTGMGLERIAAVMQGRMSVFETDLFEPIVQAVAARLQQPTPLDHGLTGRAGLYAIADHIRALTFLVGDGVVPSNEGRGYVLRMLLRKAERYGQGLGLKRPFLYTLVPVVTRVMQEGYPELVHRRESIAQVILAEEERFHQMLEEKLPLLEEAIAQAGPKGLSADQAAQLYDTHGLSYGEIIAACRAKNVQAPVRSEFDESLAKLQAKSKRGSGFSGVIFTKDTVANLLSGIRQPTEFTGYWELAGKAEVLAVIQENRLVREAKAPAKVGVILDRSPFYGEAGGQVGDAGLLEGPDGKVRVLDTQWVGSIRVHEGQVQQGGVRVGEPVTGIVDAARRQKVAQNHTATHLLHAALRKVLGDHVMQAGSRVAPDRLRFDFSHPRGVPRQELETVESLVNGWVQKNLAVSAAQMPLEEARRAGAAALFGEKYGDPVRVVSIGDVSKELCGGTHLVASGEMGLFTVTSEGSVAAGIRRVNAVTGREAEDFLSREAARLSEEKERSAKRAKEKEREDALQREKVKEAQAQAKQAAKERIGPFSFFEVKFDQSMGHAALRSSADIIRNADPAAIVLLADSQGFCVAASGAAAQKQGIRADELLKLAIEAAGGSGGGRPDLAQGRLKEPGRFSEVRGKLAEFIRIRSCGKDG